MKPGQKELQNVGLDLRSIPVRLGSEPVRRIRENADLWQVAAVYPPFGRRLGNETLPEISLALIPEVPDDVQRWTEHFPDRTHMQAEYLLDPSVWRKRATYAERERSLPYRVIYGDEQFAEHAKGGQGIPWRCSGTAFLRQAAVLIDAVEPVTARREFSVAEMVDLGVYKAHPNDDDDQQFELIRQHLRDLAVYNRRVADEDLDLIIQLD